MNSIPAKFKFSVISFLLISFFLLLFLYSQIPDDSFHIYFLDVGQGDAIFIKTPENHQILIDGGPQNSVIEELTDILPFFDKSIDLVVLTHPHNDHISGLIHVLKRYDVDNVLITGVDHDSFYYQEFLHEISRSEIVLAQNDYALMLGNVLLDIVYPMQQLTGESFSNLNNSSIVLSVKYGDKTILLTGDLEEEFQLSGNLEADILKVGHHGSKGSSSMDFLEKVMPEVAVIQVGDGNQFGHPHEETLKSLEKIGAKVYRNDLSGRIEFVF